MKKIFLLIVGILILLLCNFEVADANLYVRGNGYAAADTPVNARLYTMAVMDEDVASPIAKNDIFILPRNIPGTFNILANDTDPDSSIDVTTVTLRSATSVRGCALTVNPDGTITYTPDGSGGPDYFWYTVKDDIGTISNEATVRVNRVRGEPYCGDGNLDPGEECDDNNNIPGDGCDANCILESPTVEVPLNQFNIGDSVGEGEAANGTIGSINHDTVWSTGYDAGDVVYSLNERFEASNASDYYENNALRDPNFNHAVSGAVMADFVVQAGDVVAAASEASPQGTAGMVTILLGNNDVCAPSLDAMTDPILFEDQYRAGLDVLAQSAETNTASIHVSSIPGIYWIWNAKRSNWWCRLFVWPNVPCENLLSSPADDCASSVSRLDPDTIYDGDGSNCIRRKTFHAKIRDIYNPILRDVLQEYIDNGTLPNAEFIDVFDIQFSDSHVNGGDCFHPSEVGHALLSETEWCRSYWGADDLICQP